MQTLADLIERRGGLSAQLAVHWVARLARTIEPLHARGGAHGSLCAQAVNIRDEDPDGDGWLSPPHAVASPAAYHCPERAVGGSISPADDVWAVAVTLYYAMTGSMPFEGETDGEVADRMAGAPPSPLAVFDAGDDELQSVLNCSLERIRAERVLSIRSLRLALERWLGARGVSAAAPLETDEEDDGPTARVVIEALAASLSGPPKPSSPRGPNPPRTPLPPPPPPGQALRSAPLPPPPPPPTFEPPLPLPPINPPPSSRPPSPPKKRRSMRPKPPLPPAPASSRPPPRLPPASPSPAPADDDASATPLVKPVISPAEVRVRPSPSGRMPKHVEPPRSKAPAAAVPVVATPAVVRRKKGFEVSPTIRNAVIGVSIGLLMAGGLFMFGAEPTAQPTAEPKPSAHPGAPPSARPPTAAPSSSAAPSAPAPSGSTSPGGPTPTGAKTSVRSGDVSACVGEMFPDGTFDEPPDQSWVCDERDPRKGAERMREDVVRAGQDGATVSEGMREWAMLGWYELPTFVAIRAGCCPAAEPIVLPASDGTCRSLQDVLRDLAARVAEAASDDALDGVVAEYTKAIFCMLKSGTARLYGRYPTPRGGEDTTFKKTLARSVGRSKDLPDGGS